MGEQPSRPLSNGLPDPSVAGGPGQASGEASGGSLSAHVSDASSPLPDTADVKPLKHGDRVEIAANGGHLWWDANRAKWSLFDNLNMQHGWQRDKDEAIARCEANIPRYDGAPQPHPFAAVTGSSLGVEPRADTRPYLVRDEPKVLRRQPR
jgi:hypothetical protein